MLPGRQYTAEDIWAIASRWKWLILLPWLVIGAGTAIVAKLLPDRYQSESVVQVVPPRVSENYVHEIESTKLDERLPVIQQQILSRTKLERIIQDFGLYAEERKTALMEDIVQDMRNDIHVTFVKGDAFSVTYSSTDAKTAQKVTERLASLFLEENLRDRQVLTEGANQFLDSTLDDSRRQLLDHEKQLEDYKKKYAGELPSQLPSNVQSVQNLQTNIQNLIDSINHDKDTKLLLQRQLNDAEAEGAVIADSASSAGRGGADAPGSSAAQLAAVKNAREVALLTYKADTPPIKILDSRIKDLEAAVAAEALQVPLSPAPNSKPASPAEALRQNRIKDYTNQIVAIDLDIQRKEDAQKRMQAQIVEYQRRIDAAPARESDLVALNRDYSTLEKNYTTLLSKGQDAKVAANLEQRQIGEQFQIIDPARLPEKPYSPDRMKIDGAGIVGGLVLGLAIVGFIEYRDTSFRTDVDVVTVLALPVLATIPAILTVREKQLAVRRRRIVALVSVMVFVCGAAALAWKAHSAGWWL